ncbi:Hypothetical cytosolic protein [Bifidobacterium animalis subsp. lactis CNCM I-2494]|uniref:Hypothetical cytosolic protein n=1 Tax=Bifidobacterium animalis subsp. lactis CNCM I-2494 TaxID=1042403 RepID=A0A806FVU2_BIFAN|nr:Hypothetical cytosolic protein [Bifidobacterium animalis subsp. lactis CNCM I-2494]
MPQRNLKWHSLRKHPHNGPQTTPAAAQHTDASERWARNHPIRGTSHGSIREPNRRPSSPQHSVRKHPRNVLPEGSKMACLSEVSEKRATEWSENSIAFGSIRKTDREEV